MKMKKTALALIVLTFSLAFAQSQSQQQKFDVMFSAYGPLAGVILLMGIFLTGLVYMFGNFLRDEKVKGWAKTEAVELFYSGVLLSIILGVYASGTELMTAFAEGIDSFAVSKVCNNDIPLFSTFTVNGARIESESGYALLPCHLRVAKNFMASVFYETAGFVKAVGITHSWYTFLSSFSLDFSPMGTTTFLSGATFTHAIFGFLNAKNNALAFLFDTGVKVLTVVRFQEVLISFIGIALFPVLLTAGILLRSFMLTRKLGGLLMALALSLYFIYPIFFIFGDSIYNNVAALNYASSIPEDERSVLTKTSVDLSMLPSKIKDDPNYEEQYKVLTELSGSEGISEKFLSQLGVLTSTSNCKDTATFEEDHRNDDTTSILDYFGTKNDLLGKWLSSTYSKGGVGGYHVNQSFSSILAGIDALAKALFFSMFFSFLSIFATVAAVKSLSPMLGGDVEIAGLTHLI